MGLFGFVGNHHNQIAFPGLRPLTDGFQLPGGEELGHRRFDPLSGQGEIDKAAGAELRRQPGQFIQLPAGEITATRGGNAKDRAAAGHHLPEDGELRLLHQIGEVRQFHGKPGIRFIRAKPADRLMITQAWERPGRFKPGQFFKEHLHQFFHEPKDIFPVNKGHLQVDLGKFRLSVSA